MRVVHVDESNLKGTSQASFRIHRGLRKEGVDSHLLTRRDNTDGQYVHTPEGKQEKIRALATPRLDALPQKLYQGGSQFSSNWVPGQFLDRLRSLSPDIVQLHWIAGGFVPIEDINKIDAPIVWRLPDMWPFTGGCHHSFDCDRYTASCGSCPALESESDWDLSKLNWQRKKRVFRSAEITPVATSQWLKTVASRSSLFEGATVRKIPNPVDTDVYKPFDTEEVREALGLPTDKHVLLFGAVNPTASPYKGYEILVDALTELEQQYDPEQLALAVFGTDNVQGFDLDIETIAFGTLFDDISLSLLFAAADVFLMPSTAEAFGQTVIEALSCGTPTVAFEETGPEDILRHKQTGYLAAFKSPQEFYEGIDWLLSADLDRLSTQAREDAVTRFRTDRVVDQYIGLYEELTA